MAKYLWKASYTADGVRGLMKEGGTARRDAIAKLVSDLGGSLEAFYYAFGDDDVYLIVDLPDHATAAAVSLTVGASGAVNVATTVLLTPEEIDQATKTSVGYRPPGG